ncbi:TMV resistance protein N [Vigna radiata var. radiata]|uniref:TMV resistance protein N n=1 Tax=Vigna radiata var. radiata TaxID=3916 RepID=A0A1S3TGD4_VIGRR|nr:TMV resistance protein N [Vigna radiata var. radiata]
MSNNSSPKIKYDVFVSFRGEDVRDGFLGHLTEAFDVKKINAFVDDKLEKGEELWPSLVQAIEGSSISLIIFSPHYASSPWCLKELVTILQCKDKYGHTVIPVFYHVKPTDVRHQSSDAYRKAFAEHARTHENEVQLWRDVFKKSADLSGIESSKFRNDADLLKEIVDLVLRRLTKSLVNSKGLVGIDKRIADVESLIHRESEKARLIGLWGMGGIGKTTLAEEVYNKLRSKYEGCYFLANVREQLSRHGKDCLRNVIFSALLLRDVKIDTPNSLPEYIVRRICQMKVLIVLDDVNDSDHIGDLLGARDKFGSGSSIIVTTRDEQVLKANEADEIYHLREFTSDEALELFNLNAFNQSVHQRQYDKLSKRIVQYAKGLPLILKVLAHRLHGKNEEVWESELDKLKKKVLPTKVYDVIKLSYDDLDRKEKQIFLDLACFLCISSVKITTGYLKYLLKEDERDNSVVVSLERLKDKALITFSKDNVVCMHDSIKEMAWEIVRQESPEDPGNRSRLWDPEDIYKAFKNDKVEA